MKKIAIIGFGVVGSGVYEIIRKNKQVLTKKAGEEIDVKKILDIRDFSDHEESGLFTKDFNDLVNDLEISIVVETMGGIKFAYDYTKADVDKIFGAIEAELREAKKKFNKVEAKKSSRFTL